MDECKRSVVSLSFSLSSLYAIGIGWLLIIYGYLNLITVFINYILNIFSNSSLLSSSLSTFVLLLGWQQIIKFLITCYNRDNIIIYTFLFTRYHIIIIISRNLYHLWFLLWLDSTITNIIV